VASPIFAGCVAAVYVTTGTGHFEPGRKARVFVVGSDPQLPLGREDRRAYQQQLKHFLADAYPEISAPNSEKVWDRLQSKARPDVDDQGRPVLEMKIGEKPGTGWRLHEQSFHQQRSAAIGAAAD